MVLTRPPRVAWMQDLSSDLLIWRQMAAPGQCTEVALSEWKHHTEITYDRDRIPTHHLTETLDQD